MSTSVREKSSRICFRFVLAAAFTGLFGFIYEQFSHDVYSAYMMFAFLIPLLGGVLPFFAAAVTETYGKKLFFSKFRGLPLQIYESGIACLTVGCLFEGVVQIYGTTNRLVIVYPAAGAGLIAAGIAMELML